MKIDRLVWDSNFFGYEVGKISICSSLLLKEKKVEILNTDFELLYLESDEYLGENEFGKCYTKVTYVREINNKATCNILDATYKATKYTGNLTPQLLDLTYQSGEFSRFKIDEKFSNCEYERLYKMWIENSLNGLSADSVIVVKNTESKILAFVTVKLENDKSKIGLIAVDQSSRGLGLGTILIEGASHYSVINKCTRIFVSTQIENKMACSFYEKNGFEKFETKYIYHLWRN